ncbi:putative cysteine ligase BshC [compost metagenome]
MQQQLETLEQETIDRLADLDGQLHLSAEAVFTKIKKQAEVLEKKVRKAAKRKMADRVQQIQQLKEHTFPNDSLQERYDTFMPFYLQYGQAFFEALHQYTDPYGAAFLVLAYNR